MVFLMCLYLAKEEAKKPHDHLISNLIGKCSPFSYFKQIFFIPPSPILFFFRTKFGLVAGDHKLFWH